MLGLPIGGTLSGSVLIDLSSGFLSLSSAFLCSSSLVLSLLSGLILSLSSSFLSLSSCWEPFLGSPRVVTLVSVLLSVFHRKTPRTESRTTAASGKAQRSQGNWR